MTTERIKDDFRIQLESLKIRRKWSDEEVAKRIGLKSAVSVSNMRRDPFRASGQSVLMVMALAAEAEMKE